VTELSGVGAGSMAEWLWHAQKQLLLNIQAGDLKSIFQ
jgi:hypothetical protein